MSLVVGLPPPCNCIFRRSVCMCPSRNLPPPVKSTYSVGLAAPPEKVERASEQKSALGYCQHDYGPAIPGWFASVNMNVNWWNHLRSSPVSRASSYITQGVNSEGVIQWLMI